MTGGKWHKRGLTEVRCGLEILSVACLKINKIIFFPNESFNNIINDYEVANNSEGRANIMENYFVGNNNVANKNSLILKLSFFDP